MRETKQSEGDQDRAPDPDAPAPERETSAGPTLMSRREAGKLMGASLALMTGITGCFQRKPERKIVSILSSPEFAQPGQSLYYASTWTEGPFPYGMVVKTVDGRPVKIEGNPAHPVNRGASSAAMQASILSLYDPDRLRTPLSAGKPIGWPEADEEIVKALAAAKSVVLATRATLGPSERSIVRKLLEILPRAKHLVAETVHEDSARAVWKRSFEAEGVLRPLLGRARIILAIESDFLATEGPSLESAREFTETRRLEGGGEGAPGFSRLYVAESALTLTGANADHRLRVRPSTTLELVRALRSALRGDASALHRFAVAQSIGEPVVMALLGDLRSHRGEALVLAGSHLPEPIHAQVLLLNDDLGALGKTLEWNPSPAALPVTPPEEIERLLADKVDVVVCLGVNPVYDAPNGDLGELVKRARMSAGHGLYPDETVSACTISLPSAHNLESWNDASPRPGLFSLCQPVIAPLYESRQEAESLLVWEKKLAPTDPTLAECKDWHDYVFLKWKADLFAGAADAELRWEDVLRTGVTERATPITPLPPLRRDVAESIGAADIGSIGPFEVVVLPHPALYDGRFANNAWLQELPDPMSRLVWDNVAAMSPLSARKLGVGEGTVITVRTSRDAVELPVLVQPGMADGVIATTLGHGRTRAGAVGSGVGATITPLLGTGNAARFVPAAEPVKTGRTVQLVRTQTQASMEGRPIVVQGTLAEYTADPAFVRRKTHPYRQADIYQPYDYSKGYKWAMAVDLAACTGCGACVVACQAENNGAIVGKFECGRGREMHWLRIDRYFEGPADNPAVLLQPMLCQQCDNAPCENVCPVNATTHSNEGLNQMVYNRCIGTRYCSNNCPYKVRRFNFFDFQARALRDPVQELAHNPQVTVRSRGVMEKCTFCIQRINAVEFKAKNEKKRVADGAIVTACQQACPTGAIVFGDMNDPASRVSRLQASPRAYFVIPELNTRPNVTYLARVQNPHPDVPAPAVPAESHGDQG